MRLLISLTLITTIILAPWAQAAQEETSYEAQLREKLEASATTEKPRPLPANPTDKSDFGDWVIVTGKWEIQGETVKYLGPDDEKCSTPHGIILHRKLRMWSGSIETTINFVKELGIAHILFSYNPVTKNFYTAGLGGKDAAYTLTQFSTQVPVVKECHSGISNNYPVETFGNKNDLLPNSDDKVKVSVQQDGNISLRVNNVKVLSNGSRQSVYGDHIGLFAWGTNPVEFKNFKVNAEDLLK